MAHWTAVAMDLPEESEPPSAYRPSPGGLGVQSTPGSGGVPISDSAYTPSSWDVNTPQQLQRTRGWLHLNKIPTTLNFHDVAVLAVGNLLNLRSFNNASSGMSPGEGAPVRALFQSDGVDTPAVLRAIASNPYAVVAAAAVPAAEASAASAGAQAAKVEGVEVEEAGVAKGAVVQQLSPVERAAVEAADQRIEKRRQRKSGQTPAVEAEDASSAAAHVAKKPRKVAPKELHLWGLCLLQWLMLSPPRARLAPRQGHLPRPRLQ